MNTALVTIAAGFLVRLFIPFALLLLLSQGLTRLSDHLQRRDVI